MGIDEFNAGGKPYNGVASHPGGSFYAKYKKLMILHDIFKIRLMRL